MKRNNAEFIMSPKVDFCFKEVMRSAKVRKGFVAALLDVDPAYIGATELLPTILERHHEDDKLSILDVRIVLADHSQIGLEMQVKTCEYWDERAMYYMSKLFVEQIQKGDDYDKLKKCIHVSILDFNCFTNDDKCYRTINLRDDIDGEIYSDKIEIKVLELKKVPADKQTDGDIMAWMRFFNAKSRKEFEEMAKTNEYIKEACDTVIKISADEIKRYEYEAREKAIRDYNWGLKSARRQGQRQGEMKGIQKGMQKGLGLARKIYKLHMEGKTPEEIADICGTTLDIVQQTLE